MAFSLSQLVAMEVLKKVLKCSPQKAFYCHQARVNQVIVQAFIKIVNI